MMKKCLLALLVTAFTTNALAQNVTVKDIDQVLKETGSDQLQFVCSNDGLVVVNNKTVVTNILKVCFGAESIEFSCPASSSVTRSQDTDCQRVSNA